MNDLLSADLIPEIFEPASALFLVKISQVRLAVQPGSQPLTEAGTVTLQVVEMLRAGPVQADATIQVPAHRIADPVRRGKSNMDQWNNLELEAGENLLLACRSLKPPTIWNAVAAKPVTGPGDANVTAVRKALEIERGAPDVRGEMLKAALEDQTTLLRFFALETLSRGKSIPKSVGAGLIAQAIGSGLVAGPDRLDLGRALTQIAFFNKNDKNEGTNPIALAGLAEGLLSENDLARRLEWARLISSCFAIEFVPEPAANRAARTELLRKLTPPLATRVKDALGALISRGTPQEGEIMDKLNAAWQESLGAL